MNESLINPFTITHPTAVQTALIAGALFSRFDRSGRYIAAARATGTTEIWDLETRAAVATLDGHVKSVTGVDWSHNSRFLLTSSRDWNVIIWDLASKFEPPQRHRTARFDAPVVSASFHPRNSQIILVLLSTGEAYVADLRKEHRSRYELCEPVDEADNEGQSSRRAAMTVASFDPSGKHIFIGTSAGAVLVFNSRTKTMVGRHKISGAGNMKGFDFAKSGRRLVTNSSDRTLRQFILPNYPTPRATEGEGEDANGNANGATTEREYLDVELEPTHKFNDPINRTAWHAVSYSPDGEWLAGGAADAASHKIYIWDISNDGQFASALDGGRESLAHLHWHPSKSCIASTTNQGNILIWHCPHPERWGAFAGGFEEVDENVEYEEREDEFDIEDEAAMFERKMKAEEEEVDIMTMLNADEQTPLPLKRYSVTNNSYAGAEDEDAAWADMDPDTDGPWRMPILMNINELS